MRLVLIYPKTSESPLNFVHSTKLNSCLSPSNQFAICLYCLYLNYCAIIAKCLMLKCLLPEGHSITCLLSTISPTQFLSLSSHRSHDQVKVAPMLSSMPSISEGEAKLPLTLFSSCASFCSCMINTLSLQILYPVLLLFVSECK